MKSKRRFGLMMFLISCFWRIEYFTRNENNPWILLVTLIGILIGMVIFMWGD